MSSQGDKQYMNAWSGEATGKRQVIFDDGFISSGATSHHIQSFESSTRFIFLYLVTCGKLTSWVSFTLSYFGKLINQFGCISPSTLQVSFLLFYYFLFYAWGISLGEAGVLMCALQAGLGF